MKAKSSDLAAFDSTTDELNAIIDTPKGSRNKFKYDSAKGIFKLGGVLPLGASFPFDFGYIPSTIGQDGDPLDALILMDEPAFPGCLIPSKLIGVIEAEQTEEGRTFRNDRLIATATDSRNHSNVRFLGDLNENMVHEIEHFFVSGGVRADTGKTSDSMRSKLIQEYRSCWGAIATDEQEGATVADE